MKRTMTWTLLGIAMFFGGLTTPQAAEEEGFVHPALRVPKLAAPPVIDGQIGAPEWARAAAFTGVTAEGSVGGHGSLVPQIQQVQWYLGYDDKFLYLAMRSPHPKGTYPLARVKENDVVSGNAQVLFEDHVEVQLLTHKRDEATTQGKGFYKIMANPKAAIVDQYLFNGTLGTEELWAMGGPLKCHVTPECWELEMAVEIGRLKLDKLDNRDLVIQLVRTDYCGGMYFAGWVGAPWLNWKQFAQVSFAPDSPAFRFLKLGEIGAGELEATVELAGGKQPAEVTVEVLVENADGKLLHKDSRTVALPPDAQQTLSFQKKDLAISTVAVQDKQRRNHFEIKATAKIGSKSVVLYHNRAPFMQLDAQFRKDFLDKWIAGRPQSGEWEYKVAYLPYSDKLEASVDLDFFGMPAKELTAQAYRVSVSAKGDKKVLAQATGKVVNLTGERLLLGVPKLAAGDYVARFELLDASGGVLAVKDAAFVRKVYEWEHNRLGVSDEVIPPFTPLAVKGNSVSPWGRTYTVAPGGLPGQISAIAPTGTMGGDRAANLLAGPIRLEVLQNGKTAEAAGASAEIVSAAMHRVDVAGRQTVGAVAAELKSFVEYDGWWEFTAQLGGKATIDAADLVIDFASQPELPIDTLYVQRLGDGRNGNRFGEIPRQPGVCFKSSELLACREGSFDWKSFVPCTYVGNGDRGLWFFAWSAAGWELQDGQPMLQVERLKDGNVRLRVRLLAGPVTLEQPRTLRFALQAAPVKPNHPRYRTYDAEGRDAHDTRGYRYYGQSVDDFVNTRDKDYEELRKFLLYGQRYQTEAQRSVKGNYGWWHYTEELGQGRLLTMYGSGELTGMGPEEFKTFGGEWLGKSNWRPGRDAASDLGRWNYQGTSQWTADEQLSVTRVNWSQSMIDFFLWYHKPLLEKAGFNGTWWDNTSITIVRDYNPELGRLEEVWNHYPRRQLVKRLNVLGWQLMRPPRWAANMHVDLGWAQTFWMVENDWYADGRDMSSLDQWSLGEFRAMARTKSTMQVARPWLRGFAGSTPERDRQIQRSLWAMEMSHDIHPNFLGHYTFNKPEFREIRRAMSSFSGLVNLPDTGQCLFAGYWKTAKMVQPAGKNVHASVYSNASLGTAAVLFLNGEKQDQYLAGTALDINALIPSRGKRLAAGRIFDLETGKTVATAFEDGKYLLKEPFLVGGHDFRLLGIEAE